MASLQVGDTVEINDGRIGIIRFVGTTFFQVGEWVGVELDDFSGKNDGSVKGESYFECEMGRGMFIRPSMVERVFERGDVGRDREEERQQKSTARERAPSGGVPAKRMSMMGAGGVGQGAAKKTSRPSSLMGPPAGKRTTSVTDPVTKRMSINSASPSPAPARGLARPGSISRVSHCPPHSWLPSASHLSRREHRMLTKGSSHQLNPYPPQNNLAQARAPVLQAAYHEPQRHP